MRFRLSLATMFALALAPFTVAQNFSGSDNFSATSGNWTLTAGTGTGGGTLTVSSGLLNFSDNRLQYVTGDSTSTSSGATYAWIANAGSYTADWQVQVDFKVPPKSNLVPAQFLGWTLQISNSADSNDYFSAGLENSYMYTSGLPKATAGIVTNNSTASPVSQDITNATSAAIFITYTASTQTLAASFNDGSGATSLFSASVSALGSDWDMITGDTFRLALGAKNVGNSGLTAALNVGDFTADNFLATAGTPVPEPSTYALLAGLAALGLGVWRRRA